MPIILEINGHRYDVTNFEHPGEGINDQYLRNFNGKNVDLELDHFHNTNEPWEMLEEAKDCGEYEGIRYLGKVSSKDKKQ